MTGTNIYTSDQGTDKTAAAGEVPPSLQADPNEVILKPSSSLDLHEIPSSIQRELNETSSVAPKQNELIGKDPNSSKEGKEEGNGEDDDDDDDMSSLSSSISDDIVNETAKKRQNNKNNSLEPIPYTKSFIQNPDNHNHSPKSSPIPVATSSNLRRNSKNNNVLPKINTNTDDLSSLENLSELESINSYNTSIPYTPKGASHPHLGKIHTGTSNKTSNTFRRRTSTISSWFKNMGVHESGIDPASPSMVCGNCNHPLPVPRERRKSSVTRQLSNIHPLYADRRQPKLIEREEVIGELEEEDDDDDVDDDDLSDELDSDEDDDNLEKSDANRRNSVNALIRTDTMIEKINSLKRQATNTAKEQLQKIGFFDPEFEKLQLTFNFLKGYLFIAISISIIFAIFWGSMYNRMGRMTNLTTYVVLDNSHMNYYYGPNDYGDSPLDDSKYIPDYISRTLEMAIEASSVKSLAGWHVKSLTDLNLPSNSTTVEIRDELKKLVHHQKIFAAIYVSPNSTMEYYDALVNESSDGNFDTGGLIEAYYETGANMVSAMSYTSRSILELQLAFLNLTMENMIQPLISNVSSIDSNKLQLLSQPILFKITDLRPVSDSLVSGPQQYGLTYIHLISLLQFQFFNRYHIEIEKKLNDRDFLIFRLTSSLISFVVLSLVYTLVQVYFKIDIYSAYPGHLGFLIFWLVTFLIMAALGGVNENVVLYLQARKPHVIALWMFFWMVWNIAPTYYPFELSPGFYKYAYGFPMKNGFELYKILLFNTYKPATLARNICVLLAWVIAMYSLLPYTMHSFTKKMQIASDNALKEKMKKKRKLRKQKLKKTLHLAALSSAYDQMVDHMSPGNKKDS